MRAWREVGLTTLCLLVAAPAVAQYGGMGPGQLDPTHLRGGSGGRGGSGAAAANPRPAPVPQKVLPDPWPRLDPGAMLCDSEDALKQYQEAVATGTGDSPPPLQPGCARVAQPMPVSVVQRDGPSRTQVKVTASPPRVGWTDAWLPTNPPPP